MFKVQRSPNAPLLVPTPNPFIFAAATIQRIRRAKIALFGPILPLHNPIHVAEEIAMLDVLSGGRLLLLFLPGVPYELRAFSVDLGVSGGSPLLAASAAST